MQTFKAATDASEAEQLELDSATAALLAKAEAVACHGGKLYVAGDETIVEIDTDHGGEPKVVRDPFPVVTALAVVAGGTLLVALGSTNKQQPRTSLCLGFWSVGANSYFGTKVREYAASTDKEGIIPNGWALHEDRYELTVAVACDDLPCSVKLHYFRLGEKNGMPHASRQTVRTFEATSAHTGDIKITNVLLRREATDGNRLKLFTTTAQRREPAAVGKVLSTEVDYTRQAGTGQATVTLEDAVVAPTCLCGYGEEEAILVCRNASADGTTSGYESQLSTFVAESKVLCVPLQYSHCSMLVHVGGHTIAMLAHRQLGGRPQVSVLDMKNRLEVGRWQCDAERGSAAAVRFVVSAPAASGVYIVQQSGATTLLRQRPLQARLDAITRKKYYSQAIGVAQDALAAVGERDTAARRHIAALIAETEAKLASHLLERAKEPEAAMAHYINTIGFVSVSTVIQQFLDAKHSHLLRQYLEAVSRDSAVMRAPYAAVLLSLYVQLRDRESLSAFIEASIDPVHGYKWDVDGAIATCLNGGYYEEARRVAEASGRHSKMLEICLDHIASDSGGRAALAHIKRLPRDDQAALLQEHGHTLISQYNLEMEVTPLVYDLCHPPSVDSSDTVVPRISSFVKIYEDAPGALRVLCSSLLQAWMNMERLHGLVSARGGQSEVRLLFHQLFQLLLDPSLNTGVDGLQEAQRLKEARQLLEQGWEDPQEAPMYEYELVQRLCCVHRFKDGLLFLYRQANDLTMQQQVLLEYKDWERLVQLGVGWPGERGEHLEAVLRCLVREHDAHPDGDAAGWISSVLDDILRSEALLKTVIPLSVIDILAASETLTLDIVKPFILGHVERLEASAAANKSKIDALAAETEEVECQIQRKKNEPMWIDKDHDDFGDEQPLSAAAVYFFCGHAYNEENCEKEGDRFVCRKCQHDPQNRLILNIADPNGESRTAINEAFFNQFRQSKTDADTFRIIGEHLGNASTIL